MRYTEKESFKEDSEIFCKILRAITAPVRLCRELSTKFIFLKRSLIEKILIFATLLSLVGILVDLGLYRITGNLHWFDGKFPFFCRVIGFALTGILYLFYELHEFSIYKQIDRLVMNHVIHKEDLVEAGIASELLYPGEEQNPEKNLEDMEGGSLDIDFSLLDQDTTDQPISIDPSLFSKGTDTVSLTDSIQLEEMFEHIDFKPSSEEVKPSTESLGEGSDIESLILPESLPENLPEKKPTETSVMEVDIPNGQDVLDYQEQLANCVRDLISSGLEYVGTLSTEELYEIEEDIKNADSYKEAEISTEIAEKGINFEYESALEAMDIQKNWKIPEALKDVV